MYTPRAFAEDDLEGLDWLLARDPFLTLVTTGEDGLPFASHLPVLYTRSQDQISLRGHWARPNPQAIHAGPALAIVNGPHHYISADWYPDKSQASRVPTWNYASAHLYGHLEPTEQTSDLADIVSALAEHFEPQVGGRWRFDPSNPREIAQLRGIIGFNFHVDRVELKFKLNQNHPAANVQAVASALQQQTVSTADEVANLMLGRLQRRQD